MSMPDEHANHGADVQQGTHSVVVGLDADAQAAEAWRGLEVLGQTWRVTVGPWRPEKWRLDLARGQFGLGYIGNDLAVLVKRAVAGEPCDDANTAYPD